MAEWDVLVRAGRWAGGGKAPGVSSASAGRCEVSREDGWRGTSRRWCGPAQPGRGTGARGACLQRARASAWRGFPSELPRAAVQTFRVCVAPTLRPLPAAVLLSAFLAAFMLSACSWVIASTRVCICQPLRRPAVYFLKNTLILLIYSYSSPHGFVSTVLPESPVSVEAPCGPE